MWVVPVLAEWHGLPRLKDVFVGGGLSFLIASGTTRYQDTVTPLVFNPPKPITSESRFPVDDRQGGVITSGIDIRMGILNMRPQVRYIRWNTSPELHLNANAVQVLMGISIGK
jgi:hypothetical protein